VLEKYKPDVLVIYDDGFNYLTKMCLTNMREAAWKMCSIAKDYNCKVIVSSSDATDQFKKYIDQGFDFVIAGEGEITLCELLHKLDINENDFENIDGLIFKNKGEIEKSKLRNVMRELDSLPFPAWDLLDIKPYEYAWHLNQNYFSLNAVTTRGCPYKCNWCAKPIYGNRYNSHSPERVVEELKQLKEKFHFDHIWFCDDIFGLKPGWLKRFADLTEEKNLHLNFKIQCRADLLVQENFVHDLKRAGCESVWIGAESGSQKVLDAMDKGITIEQVAEATRLLKKYKIHPCFFLQFGYPGETEKDIDKTINMVLDLMPDDIGVSVSYPLPGTKFHENVKSQLNEKSNWTDSDELALMFRNTYPSAYYKRLQRYLHKIYRRKQIRTQLVNSFRETPGKIFKTPLSQFIKFIYYFPAATIDKIRLQQLAKPS
jgi:anaerobic magnesium-protoporphyrin IX monomethyl ester cyclase